MRKALIIGIDEYNEAPLNGCVNDAYSIAQLLETNEDGSPNFDVQFVPNIENKADMIELIDDLFTGKSEIALLYFSGHGTDYNGGYLVTPDYVGKDYGISMSNLLSIANKSECINKIIILDCCYSGRFGELGISKSTESLLGEGLTIMSASERNQVAIETDGNGVFTSLLIQGLRGGAADISGNVTPASLYSFVDQSLGGWQQRPLFKTNISRFLPIRTVEPRISKKILRKICHYFDSPEHEFLLDPSFEFMNNPNKKQLIHEPYAKDENIEIFRNLQLYESVGLVEPIGAKHMYFAAMESKSCRLTALGIHYWRLSRDKRF